MFFIGRKGKILSGRLAGYYILIQDDEENTGGYLILLSPDTNFDESTPDGGVQEGYDDWVEKKDLEKYMNSSHWEIEWLD